MANLFENEDRRVIPNWRSFGRTTSLGELNSFQNKRKIRVETTTIKEYLFDWENNKTIVHAADLLSAALVNNKKKDPTVLEASKFILNNQLKATKSQVSLANNFIFGKNEDNFTEWFKDVTLENLPTIVNPKIIFNRIKEIKIQLNKFPRNSILQVELSRYYSILGLEQKSIQAMKIALHLSSNNRFILRSASRLFSHYHNDQNDYLRYIHKILQTSPITKYDPWLISAEIAISLMRNKTSKFIKRGLQLIDSNNLSPFSFTELASNIGSIELLHGSSKKSRKLFKQALISPNGNTLAQIEWASTIDSRLAISLEKYQVKMNFEALALDNFQNENYDSALDNAAKWFIDMPFSKKPIMFASNLASTILKDQNKSISFLRAGLISHPYDPQIINNLAYSLALENKPFEAFEELDKLNHETNININPSTKICLTATKGLVYLRGGALEEGRYYYLEAIKEARNQKNSELNWIAILNYTREEIFLKSEYIESLMDTVAKIPLNNSSKEIKILKNDVINLYKEFKEGKFE